MKTQFPIEVIEWEDPTHAKADNIKDLKKERGVVSHTVGFVIHEDERYLRMAGDTHPLSEKDHCKTLDSTGIIIKSLIINRRKLKDASK